MITMMLQLQLQLLDFTYPDTSITAAVLDHTVTTTIRLKQLQYDEDDIEYEDEVKVIYNIILFLSY